MNIISYLKDKILLFLLHISCMMALSVFLLATGCQRDLCLLILCCWFLILMIWTTYEYRKRKRYFSRMEAVICQVDKRFLLGELMPHSARLEDRIYREMIRRSNGSVIEKIHAAEEAKKDYREYIESLVHEIKAPITSIFLMCENHKNDFIREVPDRNLDKNRSR
ncbi:MAG: sensor histidine kinase, partial [Lachnospiraceae bacterium]|nr:sensor histidine kinase [Lachnospiraceae bacterium]